MPTRCSYWILKHIQTNTAPEMAANRFRIQKDPLRRFLIHVHRLSYSSACLSPMWLIEVWIK